MFLCSYLKEIELYFHKILREFEFKDYYIDICYVNIQLNVNFYIDLKLYVYYFSKFFQKRIDKTLPKNDVDITHQ